MRACLLLCILLTFGGLFAQNSYEIGLLPSINLSKELPADWQLNFKAETRQVFRSGLFTEKQKFAYDNALTDFTIGTSKKLTSGKSVGIGYTFRIRDRSTFQNRTIQVFTAKRKFTPASLSHRLRTDQTFTKNQPIEWRIRYQWMLDIPLKRDTETTTGFYYVLGNEYLTGWKAKSFNLELRCINLFGYKFSDKSKLEWGLDYRVGSFVNNDAHHAFWMAIKWHWTI